MGFCDVAGYFVGQDGLVYLADPTEKKTDEQYRAIINAKIQANNASGTIPDIYTYLTTGRGLDDYMLIYDFIGYCECNLIENETFEQFERYLLNRIGPRSAGVTTDVVNWTFEYLPFVDGLNDNTFWSIPNIAETINGAPSKYLQCDTADFCAVSPVSNYKILTGEAAYGTWDFWYKKASATDPWLIPIASVAELPSDVTQDGYGIYLTSTEEIRLYKLTGGTPTQLFTTSAAAFSSGSWHKFTLTRDSATNTLTVYLDDVAVTAIAGSNPVVDSTHTTSVYTVVESGTDDLLGLCSLEDVRLTDYIPE